MPATGFRQITDRKRLLIADEQIVRELNQFLRGSPRVVWLSRDVALERPAESFCNTSRRCGARYRC